MSGTKIIKRNEEVMIKKIAFINGKGGCAKTTSLFHFAGVLAAKGEKVLLIDLDKQRNLTSSLLMNEESGFTENSKTIYDFFTKKADIYDVVKKSYIIGIGERKPKYRNIDVLPSDIRLGDEKLLKKVDVKEEMEAFINNQGYGWVLIDMPPSNKRINEICFEQIANSVLIPFSSDLYSLEGYGDIIDTVNEGRIKSNKELPILGIFLSRFMERCGVDIYIKESIQEQIKEMFIDVQIPLRSDIREGVMFGKPISYYKRISRSRTAFEKLVEEVESRFNL